MGIWQTASNFFKGDTKTTNKFNEAFYFGSNSYTTNDDGDLKKYVDLAYNINPDVYSVISQISNKVISIPYGVKKIEDENSHKKLNKLLNSTKHNLSTSQRIKALKLEYKAMSEDEFDMPLEKPNSNQDWDEFWKLSEIFLKLTGNVYWYMTSPSDGMNAGEPTAIYILPSHMMEIILKENANLLTDENVVKSYILTQYNKFIEFEAEKVVHISVENPNFGFNGEHLYGQSPLRAAWKNIEASNKGLDLNINTLKNGGVFGFIHGKGTALTEPQAKGIKDRLTEMNKDTSDLSRIAGISAEIGFQRLSLSADELKPFEYLKYNQEEICNVLGWSTALLNNDNGGKYDKQKEERKRVVTDTIIPDTKILSNAFNKGVLSLFKGYTDKVLCFEYKEIPELQADLESLSAWIGLNVDRGIMSREEGRFAMGLSDSKDPNLSIFTVVNDVMTLGDAILPQEDLKL